MDVAGARDVFLKADEEILRSRLVWVTGHMQAPPGSGAGVASSRSRDAPLIARLHGPRPPGPAVPPMTGWHRTRPAPTGAPSSPPSPSTWRWRSSYGCVHRATFAPLEFVAYEISIVSVADPDLPEEIDLPDPTT
jgi:hypothetical protein